MTRMISIYLLLLILALSISPAMSQLPFLPYQLTFPRVKAAATSTEESLSDRCAQMNIAFPPEKLYIRILKHESKLEVWAAGLQTPYALFKTYDICAKSGQLGPKKREGDLQTPEGFYHINHFNPQSSYHLSLKINYPNEADKIRNAAESNMGGDIYIHGDCVTVGCLPLTDEKIRELYWLCAKTYGTHMKVIPVHIFPFRWTAERITEMKKRYPATSLWTQWEILGQMYTYFEKNKKLLKVNGVDNNGQYLLEQP